MQSQNPLSATPVSRLTQTSSPASHSALSLSGRQDSTAQHTPGVTFFFFSPRKLDDTPSRGSGTCRTCGRSAGEGLCRDGDPPYWVRGGPWKGLAEGGISYPCSLSRVVHCLSRQKEDLGSFGFGFWRRSVWRLFSGGIGRRYPNTRLV